MKLWQLPSFSIGARELRVVQTHADGSVIVEGANGDCTTMSAAELDQALAYWAELRAHPALARRITRQIEGRTAGLTGRAVSTSPAARESSAPVEGTLPHAEAAVARLEAVEAKLAATRAAVTRRRAREIAGAQAWLARIDHADTSREHAIRCVDSGQYGAYLARCSAAHAPRVATPAQPTPKPAAAPAPLRLVQPLGPLDAERAQLLIADFGRRVP